MFDPKAIHCIVEDVVGTAVTRLPACGSPTCWRPAADAIDCPLADHAKLVIDRTGAPDPTTVTRMRCLVDP